MKIEAARKCATAQGIAEEEDLKQGMEPMSKKFVGKSSEAERDIFAATEDHRV